MKFSILVPVYNAEKYLDNCLLCVLNQTHKDFEIIFINDGSTDRSGEILDNFEREHKEVVRVFHQQNYGQLVTRQNAIKKAQGDYCIFMDADDLIVENALEILDDTISKNNAPDMVIYPFYYDRNGVLTCSKFINNESKCYVGDDIVFLRELFFEDVILNSMCVKCTKTQVLKNSVHDIGVFGKLRCAEDRLQSMWVIDEVTSAVYINKPLYRYRIFDGSVTRQYVPESISRFNDSMLYDEQIQYSHKWGLCSQEWQMRLEANVVNHIIYVFDLFYTKVEKSLRQKVLAYSWESFLPQSLDIKGIKKNIFVNDVKKTLFFKIIDKDFRGIKRYYVWKKFLKIVRNIKKKLLH